MRVDHNDLPQLKLYQLRREQNMSLRQLSQLSGLSVYRLWMLEHKRCNVRIGTLVAIAKALGVSVFELFDRETLERYSGK